MLALTSDSRDFNVTSSLAATDSIATLNRHKNALQIGFVQTRNFVDQELRQASRFSIWHRRVYIDIALR